MKDDIREVLNKFLLQVKRNDHETKNFPSFYSGLKLKVGFGQGKEAKIPWITFLGRDQVPKKGIFPVYYFFKEYQKLILAYGISEENIPQKKWSVSSDVKTVSEFFIELGIIPDHYRFSYIHTVYNTDQELEWNKIKTDLEEIINDYKKILPAR